MYKNPKRGQALVKEWNIDSIWTRPLFGAPKFPRFSRGLNLVPGGISREWRNLDKLFDPEAHAAR